MALAPSISPLRRYTASVTLAGFGLIAWVLLTQSPAQLGLARPEFWVFTALVIAGEFMPIEISRRGQSGEITPSTTFAFALLLGVGAPGAVVGLAVASLFSDLPRRKPLEKVGFNVAQYALSIGAAGAVVMLLTGAPHAGEHAFHAAEVPAFLLAAVVFFICNTCLVTGAISLHTGTPFMKILMDEMFMQSATAAMLLALSPVVVLTSEFSLYLLPLLAAPLVAIYRSERQTLLIEHQSLHDALTGLPNRRLLHDALDHALDRGRRSEIGFMLIDLDRFKEVNDTLGHHAGDMLLVEVSARLREAVREGDLVARLGGDEFAVLLGELEEREHAVPVAERILAELHRPFDIEGLTLEIGGSIGIACTPEDGETPALLMQRADVAMYQAKTQRGRYDFYDREFDPNTASRLTVAAELRRGLERGEVVPFFQPKLDLVTGEVRSFEALARWEHPERGVLGADAFVVVAEEAGLMADLTKAMVVRSLEAVCAWRATGLDVVVAVNVAATTLHSERLITDVADALASTGASGDWLELEITESSIVADPAHAAVILGRLSELGVRFSVDDFGTGYTSLGQLKQLPLDTLKIDRSFVAGLASNASDAAIVRSTIDLAHNLGLVVVAEGVEDKAVLARLRVLECDVVQGYYVSPPLAGEEIPGWLAAHEPAPMRRKAARVVPLRAIA